MDVAATGVLGPTADLREIDRRLHFSDQVESAKPEHQRTRGEPSFAGEVAPSQPPKEVPLRVVPLVQQDGDGDVSDGANDESKKKDVEDHFGPFLINRYLPGFPDESRNSPDVE